MAFPIALASAGLGLLGQGINAIGQRRADKANRQFALDMYEKQKADNLKLWQQQNTYNSPQEQMKRLQAAGLNPNLVYGSGQAVTSAGSVPQSSVDVSAGLRHPVKTELGSLVGNVLSMQGQQLQNDNIKLQNDKLQQDIDIKKGWLEDNNEVDVVYNPQTKDFEVKPRGTKAQEKIDLELAGMRGKNQYQAIQNYIADKGKDFKVSELAGKVALMLKQEGKIDADISLINQRIEQLVQEGKFRQFDLDLMTTLGQGAIGISSIKDLIKLVFSLFRK